ncbi:MAG: ArsA family ATPase [Myxococcales bacterium]|nr:ArsA family ATPase [Myxococcales bacterium]
MAAVRDATHSQSAADSTAMAGPLFGRRLLIIAGKGGVGRTTVACALGALAARQGKRVLIAQTRSKNRLRELFGVERDFSEVAQVRENLWAVNMTPEASLREYGMMVMHSAFLYRQVFERDVVRAFLRAVPGLYDYAMLGKTWFHTTEQQGGRPRFDLVILDGPATGHILTLLRLPKIILDTIPEGPMTGPARDSWSLLTDPKRCLTVLTTLAEDLPVTETIQLAQGLRELTLPCGPVVVNRLYPPRLHSGLPKLAFDELLRSDSAQSDETLGPVLRAARLHRQRAQLNEHHVARLHKALPLPQLHLPYLFRDSFDQTAIDELGDRLEGQVAALDLSQRAK